jgi:hypothetical protein
MVVESARERKIISVFSANTGNPLNVNSFEPLKTKLPTDNSGKPSGRNTPLTNNGLLSVDLYYSFRNYNMNKSNKLTIICH